MMRPWLFLLLLIPLVGQAAIEVAQFDNPEQEARYNKLIAELRCLVCQNQNLADSNADLAKDMRRKTYEMVKTGASTEDVVDYMVKRYGDFVLYRPPFRASTCFCGLGLPDSWGWGDFSHTVHPSPGSTARAWDQ